MLDSAKRPDPPLPGDQKATEPWAMPGLHPPQGHPDLSPIPAPLSPALNAQNSPKPPLFPDNSAHGRILSAQSQRR